MAHLAKELVGDRRMVHQSRELGEDFPISAIHSPMSKHLALLNLDMSL